jgi:hypothetical protein
MHAEKPWLLQNSPAYRFCIRSSPPSCQSHVYKLCAKSLSLAFTFRNQLRIALKSDSLKHMVALRNRLPYPMQHFQ